METCVECNSTATHWIEYYDDPGCKAPICKSCLNKRVDLDEAIVGPIDTIDFQKLPPGLRLEDM